MDNLTPEEIANDILEKIYLKYHWTLFFFQWLKLSTKSLIDGLNVIYWCIKHTHFLSVTQMIDMLKWNRWKQYKANGSYILKEENDIWLIRGSEMNKTLSVHFTFQRKRQSD